MARPRLSETCAKPEAIYVSILPHEKVAFEEFCNAIGQSKSRAIRRLIRDAVGAGPDFFDDGLAALHDLETAIRRVGENLNQLTRAYHRGLIPHPQDIQDQVAAISKEVTAVKSALQVRQILIKNRGIAPKQNRP